MADTKVVKKSLAGAFSPVYINSFNASQVVFRIDVTTAATGTPVSQVVCRIN